MGALIVLWMTVAGSSCLDLLAPDGTAGDESPAVVVVSPEGYRLGRADPDSLYYIDRDFTISEVPPEYEGWTLVMTANDDKEVTTDDFIVLELGRGAKIVIAYDHRADTLPSWLSSWTETGKTLITSDPGASPLQLYSRDFPAGRVSLGGNLSGGASGARSMYALLVQASSTSGAARVPAFPGAEGYGAGSVGGRGGSVYYVTRLDDNASDPTPGSLRYGLALNEPRTILFKKGGEIALEADLLIKEENSFVTIAGQSAPGSGITLRGGFLSIVGAHDVIVRYVRLRKDGNRNFLVVGGHDIIADHISAQYAVDDNVSTHLDLNLRNYRLIRDFTVSRSIIGPGLDKAVAGGFRGNHKVSGINDHLNVYDVDFHHNLLVHNSHRQLKMVNGGSKGVNNVVYNFRFKAHESKGLTTVDWINNYIKKGPMSLDGDYRYIVHETSDPGSGDFPDGSIYVSGNIGYPDFPAPPSDPWTLLRDAHDHSKLSKSRLRRTSPLPDPFFAISAKSAAAAYEDVLADVGANRRVDCRGDWVDALDALDARVIEDVRRGTGPSDTYPTAGAAGGYPAVDQGVACADSDGDGMPDEFESRYGLDPRDPGDGRVDSDGDGFTNLEEFLNGTRP